MQGWCCLPGQLGLLQQMTKLRHLVLQGVSLIFQLAQFITTNSDVESLWGTCGNDCVHCSPRKWPASTVIASFIWTTPSLSAPILVSFALDWNFFIFHGRCVFGTIPDVISLDRAQCPETSSQRSGLTHIGRVGL